MVPSQLNSRLGFINPGMILLSLSYNYSYHNPISVIIVTNILVIITTIILVVILYGFTAKLRLNKLRAFLGSTPRWLLLVVAS